MLQLKKEWDTLSDDQYLPRLNRLESELDQLAKAQYDEPNARRIAKRLLKHQSELTAFLWIKDLDPTNNAAERALRPQVVARKISGGSRSKAGAVAWARLASIMRTATQQNQKILDTIRSMLIAAWSSRRPPALPDGP